jgi:hypothetical protein
MGLPGATAARLTILYIAITFIWTRLGAWRYEFVIAIMIIATSKNGDLR